MARKLMIVVVAIVLIHARTATSQEVEDETEFSYSEGVANGPGAWGKLHKEWEICNNGKMQSPIDLTNDRVKVNCELSQIKTQYKACKATMVNRGHDIMLKWEDGAGEMSLDNGTSEYSLKQLHWHSPSEHTVNGKSFDLEMHMVHQAASNNEIAVIGILYNVGCPDPFLKELEGYIKELAEKKGHELDVGTVDATSVGTKGRMYYRYLGSLTTPPCTEGVTWTINYRARTVSEEQMQMLRDAVHDGNEENARPVQELNDRSVNFFLPSQKRVY